MKKRKTEEEKKEKEEEKEEDTSSKKTKTTDMKQDIENYLKAKNDDLIPTFISKYKCENIKKHFPLLSDEDNLESGQKGLTKVMRKSLQNDHFKNKKHEKIRKVCREYEQTKNNELIQAKEQLDTDITTIVTQVLNKNVTQDLPRMTDLAKTINGSIFDSKSCYTYNDHKYPEYIKINIYDTIYYYEISFTDNTIKYENIKSISRHVTNSKLAVRRITALF